MFGNLKSIIIILWRSGEVFRTTNSYIMFVHDLKVFRLKISFKKNLSSKVRAILSLDDKCCMIAFLHNHLTNSSTSYIQIRFSVFIRKLGLLFALVLCSRHPVVMPLSTPQSNASSRRRWSILPTIEQRISLQQRLGGYVLR